MEKRNSNSENVMNFFSKLNSNIKEPTSSFKNVMNDPLLPNNHNFRKKKFNLSQKYQELKMIKVKRN